MEEDIDARDCSTGGLGGCLATGIFVTLVAQDGPTRITGDDLLKGLKEPTRWLTFSGDYSAQRHSPLTPITPENVNRLPAQWTFQTETCATGLRGDAARRRRRAVCDRPEQLRLGARRTHRTRRSGGTAGNCRRERGASSPVNRGFGILGDRLFMVTLDAHLVAWTAKTGRGPWDTVMADYKIGYSATLAPLVVNDKVIVGICGGEYADARLHRRVRPGRPGTASGASTPCPAPGEPGSETWPGTEVDGSVAAAPPG